MHFHFNGHHHGRVVTPEADEETIFLLPQLGQVALWDVEILGIAKQRIEIVGRTYGEILLRENEGVHKVWIEPENALGSLTRIINVRSKNWYITSNTLLQFQRED